MISIFSNLGIFVEDEHGPRLAVEGRATLMRDDKRMARLRCLRPPA
jgi:hypothetical protein